MVGGVGGQTASSEDLNFFEHILKNKSGQNLVLILLNSNLICTCLVEFYLSFKSFFLNRFSF